MNKMALFSRDQSAAFELAADGNAYRYWAFLSYSHADTAAADRLHRWLEHFRLPDSLVGKPHPLGAIPKRLTPIFRDRTELAASSSLGREIEEALAASRYLIVLCSPAAAKSRWVDQEIRDFKRLHGEDRVLAAIVAGEPFSEGQDECFPPALRHRVGRDGKLTRQKIEPIAADLREDRDGQRIGSLKIAAGMLEVGLDDLVQRDQQRRQKRMTWIAAASIFGMAFTSGLSVVAINARDAARDERHEAEGLVSFLLGDLKDELEPIGRLDALDQVGARALAYYERQDKKDLTDDQLAQRSKALTLLGQIATNRGDTDGALARYREALRSTAELVERTPNDPQRLFDHAQNVFYLGDLARARGQNVAAETGYREYKRLADRMVAIDPNNVKWRMETAYGDSNIGIILRNQRRFPEAASRFRDAFGVMQGLAAIDRGNEEYQSGQANTLGWLADAERDQGNLDSAIGIRKRQIAFVRQLIASGSENVNLRARLIPAHQGLGILFISRGRTESGIEQLRLAIAEASQLLAIEPDNTTWRGFGAQARLELAATLISVERIKEAEIEARMACGWSAQVLAKESGPNWRHLQTACLSLRARLALQSGAKAQALGLAERALASARSDRDEDPIKPRFAIARASRLIGDIRQSMGESAAAQAAWSAAYAQLPSGVAERPLEINERVELLQRLGRLKEARPLVERLTAMGYRRST